jgi:aspartyl-tRNA(Asn)/glutamyl-tRNA(Gln) amidotransferase subunit B
MRSKEDALDYRYFPDPDLLPLIIEDDLIERIRATLPELPSARRARYMSELGLSEYDAARLTESVQISNWFESAIGDKPARAKPIANWMISELFAHPQNFVLDESEQRDESMRIITQTDLAELVDMISENEINGKMAKDIFIKMLDGETGSPKQIADKFGLKQMSDTGAIIAAVDDVIAKNASQVEQYKSGKVGLIGFFVGQVMKATGGAANPEVVNKILKEKLG